MTTDPKSVTQIFVNNFHRTDSQNCSAHTELVLSHYSAELSHELHALLLLIKYNGTSTLSTKKKKKNLNITLVVWGFSHDLFFLRQQKRAWDVKLARKLKHWWENNVVLLSKELVSCKSKRKGLLATYNLI